MFFLDFFEERENYCKSKVLVGDCAGVTSGEAQRHKQELQAIKEPIESLNLCLSVSELVKASTRLHELPLSPSANVPQVSKNM